MKLLTATALTLGLIAHRPGEAIQIQQAKPYDSIVQLMPSKTQLQAYAYKGFSKPQQRCLKALWMRESGWRYWAASSTSSAYGIAQVLRTPQHLTPYQQVDRGLRYINHRYHNQPCKAWTHWQHKGWY